jgi:hypothetical protein
MKTAVEYLVEQLIPKALSVEQYYHIRKAQEMEKQQIIEARVTAPLLDTCSKNEYIIEAEQYYNETFNK